MPIVITKFERLVQLDVAGNRALDCDYSEGFFRRDSEFKFEIYFEDEPGERTYRETRISEMYIKSCGCIQWSWGGPPLDKDPDWDYGKRLLADLLAGLDTALATLASGNLDYCRARFDSVVYQLDKLGIEPGSVLTAMTGVLLKAADSDADQTQARLDEIVRSVERQRTESA